MEFFDSPKEAEEAMKELAPENFESKKDYKPSKLPQSLAADRKPVEDFLKGKNCLTGVSCAET